MGAARLPSVTTKTDRGRVVSAPAEILRVADTLSPRLRRAFLKAIRQIASAVNLEAVAAAFGSRDFARLDALLHIPSLPQVLNTSAALVVQTFQQAGIVASARLAGVLETSIAFNITNPAAVRWAQVSSAELVAEVSASARASIRELVAQGIQRGIPPAETGRLMRDAIGLTERQTMAVINYRFELLEQGKTAEQVANAAERYSQQLLRQRAKLIARHETQTAAIQGQKQAWRQAVDKGLLDPAETRRIWIVADDERLCPICEPMADQEVAFEGEAFEGGDGTRVDDPPIHVSCRCAVGLVIA